MTMREESNGEIPQGWASVMLEDYISINARIGWRGLKKTEYLKKGIPFLAVKDIKENGSLNYDVTDFLSEFRYEESPEIQLENNDVLVTKDGTIGKIGFVENLTSKVTVNSSILVVRPCKAILPKYLFYYFKGPKFQEIVRQKIAGTAVPHLFQHDIKKFQVHIPPFNEQLRIVNKIDELFSFLDSGITSLRAVQAQLKSYRQAILKYAFEGKLTVHWRLLHKDKIESAKNLLNHIKIENAKDPRIQETSAINLYELFEIPSNWAWSTLGSIFLVGSGGTPSRKKSEYWNGSIPWVSSGEVAFCEVKDTKEKITKEGLKNSSAKLYPIGTVLIALYGEGKTRGQTAILRIEATTNQAVACIVCPNSPIPSEYVYWWLYFRYLETRRIKEGANQPNMYLHHIRKIPIPIAPLLEQQEIIKKIEESFSMIEKTDSLIPISLLKSKTLRQSILKKAFEGKLVSQDPVDEPATMLLKSIKTEHITNKLKNSNQAELPQYVK
jgi:type I restriction enzyme, S subunit